jgi:hypothetical protein
VPALSFGEAVGLAHERQRVEPWPAPIVSERRNEVAVEGAVVRARLRAREELDHGGHGEHLLNCRRVGHHSIRDLVDRRGLFRDRHPRIDQLLERAHAGAVLEAAETDGHSAVFAWLLAGGLGVD